jgi:hypothetical protein
VSKPKGTRSAFAARLTEAERNQIVAWSREGVSQREIARRLRCNSATIRKWQLRLGCAIERRVLDDAARAEILALYSEGLNSVRIAERTTFGPRVVLRVLHETGVKIRHGGPFIAKAKEDGIEADIRGRKDFLSKIAKKYGVGFETVRRRKKKILGNAPLKSTWPPLQSKFSQADAKDFVPSPQDVFAQIVRKCIDLAADKLLRQGRDRDEVFATKRFLKHNPQPILDKFNAGLREAVATLHLEQVTAGHTVH